MPALTPFPTRTTTRPQRLDVAPPLPRSSDSSARLRLLPDESNVVTTTPRSVAAAAATVSQQPNLTMLGISVNDTIPNTTMRGVAPIRPQQLEAAVARVRSEASRVTEPTRVPPGRWHIFEALGLRAPSLTKASKVVVTSYRLLGFAILTLIVAALLGYITTTVFYFFSRSWVTPVAISSSDEKVVALQSELATQQSKRDVMTDELDQADRAVAAEQRFQIAFAKAIQHDLEGRKLALDRVNALAHTAALARGEIRRSNDAYAASSKQRMKDELAAGLIDRHDVLAGKYQLAQISSSSLSLAEREAEFEQRATELAAQTKALDAILGDRANSGALSYDVLQIERQYETSKLELAKELQTRTTLTAGVARQTKIVDALKQSAYLRAINEHATIAFVPYGNLANAGAATKLYRCKLGMVVCHQVGEVIELLPGEVTFKHPRRDKQVRGQMVVMKLDPDETAAAEDDVLFVGGAPLYL